MQSYMWNFALKKKIVFSNSRLLKIYTNNIYLQFWTNTHIYTYIKKNIPQCDNDDLTSGQSYER